MGDRYLDPLTLPPERFHLAQSLWEQMRAHVESCLPEEACGLLAGRIEARAYHAVEVIPVANQARSPRRYRLDPEEQVRAFNRIDSTGLELVGIFHSHPEGPETPSPTDIAEAYYPECAYLIWFKSGGTWTCRSFFIEGQQVREVAMALEPAR
jgi:proteasome lid subunit RPN8/RPN11